MCLYLLSLYIIIRYRFFQPHANVNKVCFSYPHHAIPTFIPFMPCAWWRHQMNKFRRHWPFVRGIHRSPVNSPHKGQWRGALMFSLICAWIYGWVNNRDAGDLRRHRAHYDIIVMECFRSAWAGSSDWHDLWSRCFTNSSMVPFINMDKPNMDK